MGAAFGRAGEDAAAAASRLRAITLLLLMWSAYGDQHRRAASRLLEASDGSGSCFAPFLGRRVEYRLNAAAAWGFGKHTVSDRTANISAVVHVSSQLAGARESKPHWLHAIEVEGISQSKTYAKRGAPQTATASMPLESARFRVLITQRDCGRFDDIHYDPTVPPAALEIARGLALMIPLALPSQAEVEAVIEYTDFHGASPALLSIRRQAHANHLSGNYTTRMRRSVNVTKAPLWLDDGRALPLRDETS